MSFEMYFLILCGSVLFLFIAGLTISTILMGSRKLLRFQHIFNSLKYDKEVDQKINIVLDKHEAGLLHARYSNKSIEFYTPSELEERKQALAGTDHYYRRNSDTFGISIWVGNKFTQYGYFDKYHDLSRSDLKKYCGSYKTFRRILALEDILTGVTKVQEVPKADEPKKSKKPEDVELM